MYLQSAPIHPVLDASKMVQIWVIERKRDALGFEGIPFSMSRQQVLLRNFRFIGFDPKAA